MTYYGMASALEWYRHGLQTEDEWNYQSIGDYSNIVKTHSSSGGKESGKWPAAGN